MVDTVALMTLLFWNIPEATASGSNVLEARAGIDRKYKPLLRHKAHQRTKKQMTKFQF